MNRLRMSDLEVHGRTVLLRTDYNVQALDENVFDDHRIAVSVPTVQTLRGAGARVVIATHRARPVFEQAQSDLSTRPLAAYLSKLLDCPVGTVGDCVGAEVEAAIARMEGGDVLLLENLRFHPEEETNDPEFSQSLARLADLYVDDAFGTLHRSHASIVGVPAYLPSSAGMLVEREVEALEAAAHPRRPAALVLGGVKFEDRLPLIEHLLPELDVLCLGGMVGVAMLRALGLDMENVEISRESAERARRIVRVIRDRPDFRLVLPHAVVATDGTQVHVMAPTQVPRGWTVVDTARATVESFERALAGVHTVIWNGPMGSHNLPPFDRGTNELAEFISELSAMKIAAGVATTAAVRRSGVADGFDLLPSGGGSALRLLSGQPLVGLEALPLREPV